MESLYFLALILCPYYSVPKCTLFDTASFLKNEHKKESAFPPSLSQLSLHIYKSLLSTSLKRFTLFHNSIFRCNHNTRDIFIPCIHRIKYTAIYFISHNIGYRIHVHHIITYINIPYYNHYKQEYNPLYCLMSGPCMTANI